MELTNKLEELKQQHAALLEKISSLTNETREYNLIRDHENLQKDFERLRDEYKKLKNSFKTLNDHNNELKVSLREQIIDERLSILKISQRKLETYFKIIDKEGVNRLTSIEKKYKDKINSLHNEVKKSVTKLETTLASDFRALSDKATNQIEEEKKELLKKETLAKNSINKTYDTLRSEPIDEATIKKRHRQNKLEMKIGLNIPLWIGVTLIIIAISIVLGRTYKSINDYAKTSGIFVLGIAFLLIGEFLYRKKHKAFAAGLIGGGIATLYGALFFSYFVFNIIAIVPALILSIVVTLTAITLALRYDSFAIISFGLIGGYLPFLSYAMEPGFKNETFYFAMGYLFIINLLVVIISNFKKWRIPIYVSFILHVPSLIYLAFNCDSLVVGIIYSALAFGSYLFMVLAYPVIHKTRLKISDYILLALNTIVSAVVIYALIDLISSTYPRGLPALGFAIFYLLLGLFMQRYVKRDKPSIYLFYITAITFAILMIPFQFGINSLTIGWLIESVLLIIAGYKFRIKSIEIGGWGVFLLSLSFFIFKDVPDQIINSGAQYFDFKFLLITIGLVGIFTVFKYDLAKKEVIGRKFRTVLVSILQYFVITDLFLFLNYFAMSYFFKWFTFPSYVDGTFIPFYIFAIISIISFAMYFVLEFVKIFKSKGISVFTYILYFLGSTATIIMLLFPIIRPGYDTYLINRVVSLTILALTSGLFLFALRGFAIKMIKIRGRGLEAYPLIVALGILHISSSIILVQASSSYKPLILGFAYIALAFGSIFYGFLRKFRTVRFFGLILTLPALILLFIFTAINVTFWGKVIAFFGFGFLFLFIAFIYQVVQTKFNLDDGGADDVKQK